MKITKIECIPISLPRPPPSTRGNNIVVVKMHTDEGIVGLGETFYAVAPVAALVRAYPKRELLAALRADPAIAERFMAALAHQVHTLRARLEERNIRSARQRVLHHLSPRAGDDGRTMRLDGTLVELAAEIGLTHEALYRTLAALEKAGIVRRTKSEIVLRKPATL